MKTFHWIGPTSRCDGYGQSSPLLKQLLSEKLQHSENADIAILYGRPLDIYKVKEKFRVIIAMFESTRMPEEWSDALRFADLVVSPSTFCKNVIKSQFGVEAITIPLGYNSDAYFIQEKEYSDNIQFLHYDAFSLRKGFLELMWAWPRAFTKESVKLTMKTTAKHGFPLGAYKNIEVINKKYTSVEMNDLLYKHDCFLFPSMGEGFGHPPLEAMATGALVIAPNAHGIAEYFDESLMISIKTIDRPAFYEKYQGRDMGRFFQCDKEDLAEKLKYVYNNRKDLFSEEERKKRAQYAQKFTMRSFSTKLLENINGTYNNTSTPRR